MTGRPTPGARGGWTTQRLAVGTGLGAVGIIVGGLMFQADFGELGKADSPLLAIGFGLFAIGLLVFGGCLVGLLGRSVKGIAARRGWPYAILTAAGPAVLAWLLYLVGAVGYAVPAVVTLVLLGAVVAALR